MHSLKFSLFTALLLCNALSQAQNAPYSSATISGLGARNIGSATMSGRISTIAGVREPSGKISFFVGAASGGVDDHEDDDQHQQHIDHGCDIHLRYDPLLTNQIHCHRSPPSNCSFGHPGTLSRSV